MVQTHVPTAEFEARIGAIRNELAANDYDALCLFSATSIEWLSGFHHLQTERPVCLAVTDETVAVTVPRLEADRARADEFPVVEDVNMYYDYPGNHDGNYSEHPSRTPEETIATMLGELGVERVAADSDGAPGYWGYAGPSLADLADVEVETVEWVTEMRKEKSSVEFDLMRHSAEWGNLAHRKLAAYTEPGNFEIMLECQTIGIEESGPGVPCADVDQAVHDYLDEQGVPEHAQHHTGHNLGMEAHEREFIDRGSEEVMRPGHAYSIEPGIYFPGDAGYRHSDTILVIENGTERITYYPREIESNVIQW